MTWIFLHQADGFNGVHSVSIVMCLGKVETARKLAGRVTRVKLDAHTDVKPKHQGKAECNVGGPGKHRNT